MKPKKNNLIKESEQIVKAMVRKNAEIACSFNVANNDYVFLVNGMPYKKDVSSLGECVLCGNFLTEEQETVFLKILDDVFYSEMADIAKDIENACGNNNVFVVKYCKKVKGLYCRIEYNGKIVRLNQENTKALLNRMKLISDYHKNVLKDLPKYCVMNAVVDGLQKIA